LVPPRKTPISYTCPNIIEEKLINTILKILFFILKNNAQIYGFQFAFKS
jgi:hypothetical protein